MHAADGFPDACARVQTGAHLCIDAIDLRLPLLRQLAVVVGEQVPCSRSQIRLASAPSCVMGLLGPAITAWWQTDSAAASWGALLSACVQHACNSYAHFGQVRISLVQCSRLSDEATHPQVLRRRCPRSPCACTQWLTPHSMIPAESQALMRILLPFSQTSVGAALLRQYTLVHPQKRLSEFEASPSQS